MLKILRYTFFDLIRSRWIYIYFGFYAVLTTALIAISSDFSQVVLSLMNILLVLVPMVATIFGVLYYYSTKEFTELLLAQPLPRSHIFLGQYFGLTLSLTVSMVAGVITPCLIGGIAVSNQLYSFMSVVGVGLILTAVFTAISTWIALKNDNKIRGFSIAILLWLFFAVIYDGLFLIVLSLLSDYPIEKLAIAISMLNPIDLGRILVTLQMDIAALMGFTGAVFQKTIGTGIGQLLSWGALILWVVLPVLRMRTSALRKDF